MRILALDLATRSGWAVYDHESGVESGTANFTPTKGNNGSRYRKCREFLQEIIDQIKPDVVYVEDIFARGKKTNQVLNGYRCCLEEACGVIPINPVAATTIKKHATGGGRASKKQMVRAVERLGYHPKDDNEADALALLMYAREEQDICDS